MFQRVAGNSQDVDLWYKPQAGSSYVKIEPSSDVGKINLAPSNLNIDSKSYAFSSNLYSKEKINELYGKYYYDKSLLNYSMSIGLGGYGKITLPQQLKFPYNNLDEYSTEEGKYKNENYDIVEDANLGIENSNEKGFERVFGSVSTWYGNYGLPNTTIAVSKGTNPNSNSPSVLKEGYILVSFDITSKYNMDGKNKIYSYLDYKGPEGRFKKTENQEKAGERKEPSKLPEVSFDGTKTIKLPNGSSATIPSSTVLMFESDYKANADYSTGGV